mgnify:CR=1 FL=1
MKLKISLFFSNICARDVLLTDTNGMMLNIAPEAHYNLNNYGCSGANYLDIETEIYGLPIDDVDNAISAWKICIWSANDNNTQSTRNQTDTDENHHILSKEIPAYTFDLRNNLCSAYKNF